MQIEEMNVSRLHLASRFVIARIPFVNLCTWIKRGKCNVE